MNIKKYCEMYGINYASIAKNKMKKKTVAELCDETKKAWDQSKLKQVLCLENDKEGGSDE